MTAQAPEWLPLYTAARAWGTDPVALAYHPHAAYWVREGLELGRFQGWVAERSRSH